MTFGEFWNENVRIPLPDDYVIPVGYPYVEKRLNAYNDVEHVKQLLFISQGTVGEELSRFALEVHEDDRIDHEVVYKVHPGEYDRWEDEYPWLAESSVRVIDEHEPPLYRLEKRAPVSHAHTRSLGKSTGAILREAFRQHPADVSEQVSRNTPVDDIYQLLRDTVEYPFVILDEVNNIHDHDLIERLHAVPRISTVAICHDPQSWLAQVPMGDSHSFHDDQHIQLRRYGTEELADILEARANKDLAKDLVTRDQLRTIANHVAGVARFGIQSLYTAAKLTVERSHGTIRPAGIDDSYDRALHRIRHSNLNSLPLHHHVLFELIRVAEEISASEPSERYDNATEQLYAGYPQTPIGKRSRRDKLSKHRKYELIEHEGAR